MHISRIDIENIRIVERFTLDLHRDSLAGWHVLLGDNGAGKSTVIRSIASALAGEMNAAALRQDWNAWLSNDKTSGRIGLSVRKGASTLDRWKGQGRHSDDAIRPRVTVSSSDGPMGANARFRGDFADRTIWGGGKGWFSAAFGPFRRFKGGDRDYDKLYYSHPRLAAHLSAFGEDVALSEALEWVKSAKFRALDKDRAAELLTDGLIAFVNRSGLLPHGARIDGITSAGVIIDNGAGALVPVEEMSDGYRSVLSMTFEIIRAMDAAYGTDTLLKALDPEAGTIDLPGVILIDEVDAHLHPAWQARIGTWMTRCFPQVQFFVTTHSPIICQAARSIWRLATPGSDQRSGRVTGQDFDRLVNGNIMDAYSTEHFGKGVTRSARSRDLQQELAGLNIKGMRGQLTRAEQARREELRTTLPTSSSTTEA